MLFYLRVVFGWAAASVVPPRSRLGCMGKREGASHDGKDLVPGSPTCLSITSTYHVKNEKIEVYRGEVTCPKV